MVSSGVAQLEAFAQARYKKCSVVDSDLIIRNREYSMLDLIIRNRRVLENGVYYLLSINYDLSDFS